LLEGCTSNAPMSLPSPPSAFGTLVKSTGRLYPRWSFVVIPASP
jgi:hypothetical protein